MPYVDQMIVDETKEKALTRFANGNTIPSDHNLLSCIFNIPVRKVVAPRTEVYRLRNQEELNIFKENTTNTKQFTNCFTDDGDVRDQGKKWMKLIQKTIRRSFKKVRIRPHNNKENSIQNKMKQRSDLQKNIKNSKSVIERHALEDKLKELEESISQEHKQKQIKRLEDHLNAITDQEGKVNTTGVWKLRRKIFPKQHDQLSAKKDKYGNLVTNPEYIKKIYLDAYIDRLKHEDINPELSNLKTMLEILFKERLARSKLNKSPDWVIDDLDKVLKSLKEIRPLILVD